MQRTVKCDAELLKLLQQSNSEEIDFLVDVLTDNGAGRLALSSSIKDLLLSQKAYKNYNEDGLRNLLHELQEYGGHSMMNMFRNEPISYNELLNDVYKKLNGKESNSKSLEEKEKEIVFSLFGEDWITMMDCERWDRCTNFQVVSGFFDMEKNLNFNKEGIAFGLSAAASTAAFLALRMFPPAAVASTLGLAFQSVNEAYRITIPFVVQIARIRMIAAKV